MHHEENTFCEFTPSSWKEARELALNLCYWVFRGQSDSEWKLTTTLERAALYSSCEQRKIPHIEQHILIQFQRRASQYINDLPENRALFEWLSLIQHHGGGQQGFLTLHIHFMLPAILLLSKQQVKQRFFV